MSTDTAEIKKSLSRRRIAFIAFLLVAVVASTIYLSVIQFAFKEKSFHQQSTTPVTTLVINEIIRPLHLSEALAANTQTQRFLTHEGESSKAIKQQLESFSEYFNLNFFIASERTLTQYFSSGKEQFLVEGEIGWYFRHKAMPERILVDVGDKDDIKIFYNIRVIDQGNFVGFVGVSQSLSSFMSQFNQYKQRFGYDMVLINRDNQIMLSSYPDLNWDGENLKHLDDFIGFASLSEQLELNNIIDGNIMEINHQNHMISAFPIDDIQWKLLLISPIQDRQNALFIEAIKNLVILLLLSVFVYFALSKILSIYSKNLKRHLQSDSLTKLANRDRVSEQFKTLHDKQVMMALVMLDLDHFKSINDQYGHNTGDRVLKEIARVMNTALRSRDIIGRWGGEEFILLLPHSDLEDAVQVTERLRLKIKQHKIDFQGTSITVTSSFGVAMVQALDNIESAVERSDALLYLAKQEGRDKVCAQRDKFS